jgi:class 3 adenylate cyclase/tetratricopeptide (TPR) repeat protein
MIRCPACAHENPEGSQFCNVCGSPLAETSGARREERKFVTVLFADLVGFTSQAETMDPEDVRALLTQYHGRVRYELERLAGSVEKFIGDAVMAVFGAPQTHEDDPERAVRAALAVRDWARDEEADVQLRIGVHTGEVLVTLGARPSEGEAMVAGDVVNSAARIQGAAPVNGILVGESTYRATRGAIEYRLAEPVVAKGKSEPIPVWEAIAPRSRVAVERMGGADLVGRDKELAILRDALARVKSEREPQLVTLVGIPGIGKSRLVYELFKLIEVGGELTYWRRGRSLPYGEGVAFWALSEMVKAQAGILEGDPAGEAEEKLSAAVSELITDEGVAGWVAAQLLPLIGVAGDGELRGAGREEAFLAWRRLFEAMAERRPMVMVFEDLHWADEALLDFVDELVDWATGVPLLVIGTARPELLAHRPGWGGGKPNAVTISLSPLTDEETARLVHDLLGRAVLPADTQTVLLERAGGNPLYAEEFVALAQERGLDVSPTASLPESVQGILSARLDALDPDEKALIQEAAVLGRVFWAGALAHVANLDRREIEQRLHALERREFVRRERRTSVAGETEYVFRHLLVRDVAYAEIPRRLRAERHRLAAEWIESLGRPEDHAELLAHHYLAALDYVRATPQDVRALGERAREALRRAGDRALSLHAFEAAVRFYASALELWSAGDPQRPELLLALGEARYLAGESAEAALEEAVRELVAAGDAEQAARGEVILGQAEWEEGRRDLAYEHVERAGELLRDQPPSPSKARVLSEVSRYHMLGGRNEEAVEVGRHALEMAKQLGLDEVRAHALNNIGTARGTQGDPSGVDDVRESIEIAAAAHSVEAYRGWNNLGATYMALGDFRSAAEAWASGVAEAERHRLLPIARWLFFERLPVAYGSGRWDEFERLAAEFTADPRAPYYLWGYLNEFRGRVRLSLGDLGGAVEDAEAALANGRQAKDPQRMQGALAFAAFTAFTTRRTRECEELVDELLRLDPARIWVSHVVPPILDLAWVLTGLGRGQDFLDAAAVAGRSGPYLEAGIAFAGGDMERAADLCAEVGVLPNEAYTRLRAAEKLLEEGRRAEAEAQLQRALEFYRSVGAAFYIRQAEALMAASA